MPPGIVTGNTVRDVVEFELKGSGIGCRGGIFSIVGID